MTNAQGTRQPFVIREAKEEEFGPLGQLMVSVYSNLDGFPKPEEQPHYYDMLANIGRMTQKPGARLLVAVAGGARSWAGWSISRTWPSTVPAARPPGK